MSAQLKNSLVMLWLAVTAICLALPVFLPSDSSSVNPAENVMGAATVTMFILSFPSSLFGIPLIVFVDYALGVDPNSIVGRYLNMFLLFVLGSVQWFWILPRIFRREPELQVLSIPAIGENIGISEGMIEQNFMVLDRRERTPIERVITEDDD